MSSYGFNATGRRDSVLHTREHNSVPLVGTFRRHLAFDLSQTHLSCHCIDKVSHTQNLFLSKYCDNCKAVFTCIINSEFVYLDLMRGGDKAQCCEYCRAVTIMGIVHYAVTETRYGTNKSKNKKEIKKEHIIT
jgi:hypothetical protein